MDIIAAARGAKTLRERVMLFVGISIGLVLGCVIGHLITQATLALAAYEQDRKRIPH
jgi:hypothetical protein